MKKQFFLMISMMFVGLIGWAQSRQVNFQSTDVQTSGSVALTAEDDQRTVTLSSDFRTQEGPDLHVYLASDTSATDFINLGLLKSLTGKQTYEVPQDASIEEHPIVLIYCKKFSHLFGYAELDTKSNATE